LSMRISPFGRESYGDFSVPCKTLMRSVVGSLDRAT
jgi:hypothetical protein